MEEFNDDELDEFAYMREDEADVLISLGFLDDESSLEEDVVDILFKEALLRVTVDPGYPIVEPEFRVVNRGLSRECMDVLLGKLREIVSAAREVNNAEAWRGSRDEGDAGGGGSGVFEPDMVVLRLAKETKKHVETYRTEKLKAVKQESSKNAAKPSRANPSKGQPLDLDTKKPSAIPSTPTSTHDMAYSLLKLTPQGVADKVPAQFRVLHVEQVLRADLFRKFKAAQAHLREELEAVTKVEVLRPFVPPRMHGLRRTDMVDYLAAPKMTFHGTRRQVVASIVRNGFVMPGTVVGGTTGKTVEVRCGSTYGMGIYSSPDAQFALDYTGHECSRTQPGEFFGIKLVVCATLLGRARGMTRDDNWRHHSTPFPGTDSHVANKGFECVVFSPSRIVPVYVVHLDWGAHNAQHFRDVPDDPAEWTAAAASRGRRDRGARSRLLAERFDRQHVVYPGDRARDKEAARARAGKYFPHGYGPATGSRFVVEEVGEVSDDEEEYGDYQQQRMQWACGSGSGGGGDEGRGSDRAMNTDFWAWVNMSEEGMGFEEGDGCEVDEYGVQRRSLGVPGKFKGIGLDEEDVMAELREAGDDTGDEGEFGIDRLYDYQ